MRVLTWPIPGVVDPEAVFAACWKDAPAAFWLDSGGTGTGTSYLGAASWSITAEELREAGQDVFSWLRAERTRWDVDTEDVPGGFALGLIGWLGYELYEETLGLSAPHPRRHPEALFMRVDRALAIDHATGQARLMARGHEWAGELATWRDGVLAAIAGAGAAFLPDARNAPVDAVVRWRHSDADYAARIRACQQAIADGDAYVLCLTTEVSVDGDFDPWEVYRRVRRTSPSHHGAYLRADGVALLSASPEQFLLVTPDGRASTKPIKGTRPRGATPEEDAAIAEELRRSDKERAENVMIVDLMRNDLSRTCVPGSVGVDALLEIESYPAVHQLVSTVSGRLRPGISVGDLLAATFPAGSMTGAPKLSAMTILHDLEGAPRGVFSGAFGWVGDDGALDLAMVIRSIVMHPGGAYVGAGGGITWRSEAAAEVEEVGVKARGPLAAIGATLPEGW